MPPHKVTSVAHRKFHSHRLMIYIYCRYSCADIGDTRHKKPTRSARTDPTTGTTETTEPANTAD